MASFFFDTLEALIGHAEKTPGARFGWPSHGTGPDRMKFAGTRSFADAVRVAREGWPAGRAAVEAARAHFEHVTGSRTRRAVTVEAFAGFAPDVPAFLAGAPDCMLAREDVEAEAAGKILRLVVQGATSAAIPAAQIVRRGALIVALVDCLEAAGRSVEVHVSFAVEHEGDRSESVVCAKRTGEPVEIDRLAFILAHPAAQRRLGFACWECDVPYVTKAGLGYGYVADATDRGDLYVPGSDIRIITDGDAVAWFRQQLAAVGITFDA